MKGLTTKENYQESDMTSLKIRFVLANLGLDYDQLEGFREENQGRSHESVLHCKHSLRRQKCEKVKCKIKTTSL